MKKNKIIVLIIVLLFASCSKNEGLSEKIEVDHLYWGIDNNILYISTNQDEKSMNMYMLPTFDEVQNDQYIEVGWQSEEDICFCDKVIISCDSNHVIMPYTLYGWFQYFYCCKDITGLKYIDTSNVVNMGRMFYCCFELEKLDLSTFDTSNTTNFQSMFDGCNSLEYLDISSFDTNSAIYIQSMFGNPNDYIKKISIDHFNLSNAIDIRDISDLFDVHAF